MSNPLYITFSNGISCHFDIYISKENIPGKIQFTSEAIWKDDSWSLSFTEDEINDYAEAVCTRVCGSEFTSQDTAKVCAIFFMILNMSKEN